MQSQVDIYSYGLLLFTVVSNGHKPHEEITDPYEIDKAIEEVRNIEHLPILVYILIYCVLVLMHRDVR